MSCTRHAGAATIGGQCAACLLEEALGRQDTAQGPPASHEPDDCGDRLDLSQITIQIPLGATASTRVYLVKSDGAPGRFARWKIWRTAAPPGFVARVEHLRAQLSGLEPEVIEPPLRAMVDTAGRPSVLSAFRQGVPILEAVDAGHLAVDDAMARMALVTAAVRAAHGRGLAHGSIGPGNIITDLASDSVYLLDFGMAAAVAGRPPDLDTRHDLDRLAGLDARIRRTAL